MSTRSPLIPKQIPIGLGALTLASVAILLVWDVRPGLFPAGSHDVLGALPLVLVAVTLLAYQANRRPSGKAFFRAALLAAAFGFWAINQALPNLAQATLFNDLAITLFVIDVFLVMVGWPSKATSEVV